MSNYESISQKVGNNGTTQVEVSDTSELRELFNVTPEVVTVMKESKGSADVGAALTRSAFIEDSNTLLEQTPAKVDISAAPEVVIGNNCQWVIPKDSNQSIVLKSLILGKGASIKAEHTTLSLTVENLKYADNPKTSAVPVGKVDTNVTTTYHIGIFGSKGNSGNKGQDGAAGAAGDDGNNSECGPGGGTPIGGKTATDGAKGAKGLDGDNGGNGMDGKPSMPTILTFESIDNSVKNLAVYTTSGAGGDGGNGGNGGDGGDGGKGGDGSQCGCTGMDAANGGDGGDGGDGGNGGNGGNGANGMPITITVPDSFNTNNIQTSSENAPAGKKGSAGKAGNRGKGGARGNQGHKYSKEGVDGKEGSDGKAGSDGQDGTQAGIPGTIKINTTSF